MCLSRVYSFSSPTINGGQKPAEIPVQSTLCVPTVRLRLTDSIPQDLTGRVKKISDLYFAYGGFSEIYKGIYQEESGAQLPVSFCIFRMSSMN